MISSKQIVIFFEENPSEDLRVAYINSLFDSRTKDNLLEDSLLSKGYNEDEYRANREKLDNVIKNLFYASRNVITSPDGKNIRDKRKENSKILSMVLSSAKKHGVKWCQEVVDNEQKSPFIEMNDRLFSDRQTTVVGNVPYVTGTNLRTDLETIKKYREFCNVNYSDYEDVHISVKQRRQKQFENYKSCRNDRDQMRSELFGLIADGKTNYDLFQLAEFYQASDEEKVSLFCFQMHFWKDETEIIGHEDKYPEYERGMSAIEKRILNEFPIADYPKLRERMLQQTKSEDTIRALLAAGTTVTLEELEQKLPHDVAKKIIAESDILRQQGENKRIAQELDSERVKLKKEKDYVQRELEAIQQERATSVNANEDLQDLTDEDRKESFVAKKKLMTEHPIMIEPCLNSMCIAYVLTEDEQLKKEMLSDLYTIRKGAKTDTQKRDMAKAFKRVLDKNPKLKKDENLVALSKIDTIVAQPTKVVKKQVTR